MSLTSLFYENVSTVADWRLLYNEEYGAEVP